jgi:hypothetical protein
MGLKNYAVPVRQKNKPAKMKGYNMGLEEKFYELLVRSERHKRALERAGICNCSDFLIFCIDRLYCNNVVKTLNILLNTKGFGEKCEAYLWESAKKALSQE